jgi:hypothetical protein
MAIIMDRNLISICKRPYCVHRESFSRKNIMSNTIDFIRSLFRAEAPAAARGTSDLWTLFQMSRGRDSVSPAVLRRLADHAAK